MQRAHLNLMGITGSRCWGVRAQGAEVRAFRFRAWGLGCARDGECVCVYTRGKSLETLNPQETATQWHCHRKKRNKP